MRLKGLVTILVLGALAGGAYGVVKWRAHSRQQALAIEITRQITVQCIPQARSRPMLRHGTDPVLAEKYCSCAAEPVAQQLAAAMTGRANGATQITSGAVPDRADLVSDEVWACYDSITDEEVARRSASPRLSP